MDLLRRLLCCLKWLTDRHHCDHPLSSHPFDLPPRHVEQWGMDWDERDD